MRKLTKLSIQWFYNLLFKGECDLVDFKEQLGDKNIFGKSQRNFSPNYEEFARDVVAFANKKGGFLLLGISDSKELNSNFKVSDSETFKLIRQIQDRTNPSITLTPHFLKVGNNEVLVLEIPFSNQLHCTTKGEYLIRSNDGNKTIAPHEMATIMSEKGLVAYDDKVWNISLSSVEKDTQNQPVPGWQSLSLTRSLYIRIEAENPRSAYLKNTSAEFIETLGLFREENGKRLPTTTGLLFIGNDKARRNLPYSQIKYVRYHADGTYTPYEFTGDIITIADTCFKQLVSEINLKEFNFGLIREYVEDYPQIVLRELLINALAHRDYSRQQIIEIRKYPSYIEFESPGTFPEGVTTENYLRKTNPRNPNIMDVFREINFAEKAGSGFDKIFVALLTKGKALPTPIETETSVLFRIEAESFSEKLIELSVIYRSLRRRELDLETALVLNAIYTGKRSTYKELAQAPFVNEHRLRPILDDLLDLEFIEQTGSTSALKYLIHKSKLSNARDERQYLSQKKQERFRQEEAILRYLDEFEQIDNQKARQILNLPPTQAHTISRLFSDMLEKGLLVVNHEAGHHQRVYRRKTKAS